jgi:hypothetical protein
MMRNCLILGSGRSGTSLAAGLLARAGYFMGDRIDESGPRQANPKGQFEDHEINAINEDLIGPPMRAYRRRLLTKLLTPQRRRDLKIHYPQRWLAALPPSVKIAGTAEIARRIEAMVARAPYCFKDPRFSYTLNVWRPFVDDAVFICAFRHPAITAASIVTECATARYLSDVRMDRAWALRIWHAIYRYILQVQHPAGGEWLFVHYDQLMDGSKFDAIENALRAPVDRSFAEPGLRRSRASGAVPRRTLALYRRLCELAGYREPEQ